MMVQTAGGLPLFKSKRTATAESIATASLSNRSSGHDAFQEIVLAQGLGDADRQAPRDEKGDCGAGPPIGCDHAPHLG